MKRGRDGRRETQNGRRGKALMEEVASELREAKVKECKGGDRVRKMSYFCKDI